jgi:hypothetical protein
MARRAERLIHAREQWLADGDAEHFGDAMLLCQMPASGTCSKTGRCQLDGFCFRGLASAEVRRGFHERLAVMEVRLRELLLLALPQRIEAARKELEAQVSDVRGVVLHFDELARRRERKPPSP